MTEADRRYEERNQDDCHNITSMIWAVKKITLLLSQGDVVVGL